MLQIQNYLIKIVKMDYQMQNFLNIFPHRFQLFIYLLDIQVLLNHCCMKEKLIVRY